MTLRMIMYHSVPLQRGTGTQRSGSGVAGGGKSAGHARRLPRLVAQRPDVGAAASTSTSGNNKGGSSSSGLLQRLGRVLKDKAASDFDRFFKGASKTRERLGLVDELLSIWSLDDYESTLEELEEALISADFGPKTAFKIVDRIRDGIKAGHVRSADDARAALKAAIVDILTSPSAPQPAPSAAAATASNGAFASTVMLIVGVNGAGKTTTIGKLAHRFAKEAGARVMLVPGDTFRAAAAEQLAGWAARAGQGVAMAPVPAEGTPPQVAIAAALASPAAADADVILCDTAGRLHTAYALMEELTACRDAIAAAAGAGQPAETLLVLDGTTGLNMLPQAREFNGAVRLTGLILTKLDGTARGGAVVSVVDALRLPVRFVGVGEAAEDLQPFDPAAFADALFPSLLGAPAGGGGGSQ